MLPRCIFAGGNVKFKCMAKIKVQETEVTVVKVNNEDYFCLTDMIRAKDGDFFVTDWLRNRNTLEYLGVWEHVYNPYLIMANST